MKVGSVRHPEERSETGANVPPSVEVEALQQRVRLASAGDYSFCSAEQEKVKHVSQTWNLSQK
jgi:hypothetical protein